MPCSAKLIFGVPRPGRLIFGLLGALFRIMWISPLLAAASRAFPLRRGCVGLLPGVPSLFSSRLRWVMARAAAQVAWPSRKRPPARSPDLETFLPGIRKFSALCGLTQE